MVKKWRKQFVNGRITLEDDSQSGRPPRSDFSESLRTLIDETSFISWKRMWQKLRILKTTCLRVLHDNFEFRKYYLKCVLHAMTENEAQCLVTCSEELLQVVRHAKEANFEHLLAGDEPWFHYEDPHDSAWAPSRTTLRSRKTQKIQTKNVWLRLFGRRPAFTVFLFCLPGCGTMQYDAGLCCASVRPDIERSL
jgi:hypothetical protein